MGNYTLLADENCEYSKNHALYDDFRAHVIFNIITNGTLTFSDNQIMSSPNLRMAMRRDGVIKELLKEKHIVLRVREVEGEGIQSLDKVFSAFLAEGKIPIGLRNILESPEINFMQEFGTKEPWSFSDVRRNFTDDCKSIIFDNLARRLNLTQMESIKEIISEEEIRDNGALGRAFLQNRLPGIFERYDIMSEIEAKQLLRTYTDAVYLSNLPKTYDLNPIYAHEHSDSFQLLRGYNYSLDPFGDEIDLKCRLDARHFTHGLTQLDLDDVYSIQQSDAFKEFNRLCQVEDALKVFNSMFVAYGELNRIIEDRIVDRFRNLLNSTTVPDPRKIRRQYGTAFENGVAILMDVLAFGLPNIPGLGIAANHVVDAVRKKLDPPRDHLYAAQHDLKMEMVRQYLQQNGQDQKVNFGEEIANTSSFRKEITVG